MDYVEFTPEQTHGLDEISRIDEWDRDVLEKLVRQRMFEGKSFQRAIMLVLSQAKRPVDVDPKRKEILEKAVKLRDKMMEDYNNYQAQKKAGVIV